MTQIAFNPAKQVKTPRFDNIPVTDEIIEAAKKRSSSHCMTAEAIRAAIPGAKHISVDVATIRFTLPELGVRVVYLTPRINQENIVHFDQEEEFPAFKFSLRGGHVMASGRRGKARLEKEKTGNTDACSVPVRVGGRPPPRMKKFSRREYGLRQFKR